MPKQKRYESFTLRRGQFWLFFLAGFSAASLTILISDPTWSIIWLSAAVGLICLSVAGRLRDLGCNAWMTPIALLPGSIAILGFHPGDENQKAEFDLTDRVIRVAFSTLVFLAAVATITGIPDLATMTTISSSSIGAF